MVKIPIILKLKKESQRNLANVQDIIVGELYRFFPKAIIHGGTGIWRCYDGNRFSEDVDVYINRNTDQINELFKSLEQRGFKIIKKRIKENSIYSELEFNKVATRFEATFQDKKPFSRKYETSESFFINVYTLSPEDLIIEKIETYLKRLKIRDLYDIYFLLNHIKDRELIENHLKKLVQNFEKPKDENNLANIIIIGAVPSSNELLTEIKKWVR